MNSTRYYYFREYFISQTNHWFFYVAVLLYSATQLENPTVGDGICWFILGFLPLILYIIRDSVEQFAIVAVLHLLLFSSIFFLPVSDPSVRRIFMMFSLLYSAASFLKALSSTGKLSRAVPLYISLPIYAVVPFYYDIKEIPVSYFPYCMAMILFILNWFLAFFLDKYLYFIAVNTETASTMPKERIFRSGLKFSVLYLSIAGSILTLISIFTIPGQFYRDVRLWFRDKLKMLLSLLLSGYVPDENGPLPTELANDVATGAFTPESGGPAFFWVIMEYVAKFFLSILLPVAFIYIVYRLLRFLLRIRYHFSPEEEEAEEDEDIHESLSPKSTPIFQEEKEKFMSITQQIRFLFKRKALSTTDEPESLRCVTAREFAEEQHNLSLAEIYEKARYSQKTCDREDLKKMQAAFRRKNHAK